MRGSIDDLSAIRQEAVEQTLALDALEALHVKAVLSAALEKLALIGVINVDPAAQAQALTESVGDEIGRMISAQQQLERRFEELVAAQHELRGQPNKIKLQENEARGFCSSQGRDLPGGSSSAQLAIVSEELRSATQQLCRNLKDNLNIAHQRASLVALLSATLRSLDGAMDGQASVLPVVEAVNGFEQEEARARELVEAERAASAAVRSLRQDLKDERAAHEVAMQERRLALASLKEQLRGDKLRLAVEGRYLEKDLAASSQAARRLQSAELEAASNRLALLRQQIEIERSIGAAATEHLGRAAAARQDDAVGWGSRREEDVHAKERQIELVRAQHQRDAMRLKDMEGRLAEEQELKARRDDRKRAEAEAAEREAADAVRRLRAAVKIQAAWRGCKLRANIAQT
ncbi:flagellar associated protein [Monoraphidium neglectum]|uniref:Dynein regulatory complex protein 9 n=1 Tax=Monoraphidium neglectum TaxID=145388 RepID=A0A0D2J9I4_9CHLO|nr:flagellar associated protein [Monoraphidium neglectum]KIY96422.1 flagellar associated protein [Monoraphidium neglectum]|eukprot:XP_013895442.1 flagellar associated protein [Monoraphidium neglectum]